MGEPETRMSRSDCSVKPLVAGGVGPEPGQVRVGRSGVARSPAGSPPPTSSRRRRASRSAGLGDIHARRGTSRRSCAADRTIINYSSDIHRNETVLVHPARGVEGAQPHHLRRPDQDQRHADLQRHRLHRQPCGRLLRQRRALVNVGGIYAAAGNISTRTSTSAGTTSPA